MLLPARPRSGRHVPAIKKGPRAAAGDIRFFEGLTSRSLVRQERFLVKHVVCQSIEKFASVLLLPGIRGTSRKPALQPGRMLAHSSAVIVTSVSARRAGRRGRGTQWLPWWQLSEWEKFHVGGDCFPSVLIA